MAAHDGVPRQKPKVVTTSRRIARLLRRKVTATGPERSRLRALAVLQDVEDADPGGDEVLQGVRGFDLLAPEPRLLRHDEHLEGPGVGRRAAIRRTHPGRLANLAPKIPSSTSMWAGSTVQPFARA
jgi:hypothetical protein